MKTVGQGAREVPVLDFTPVAAYTRLSRVHTPGVRGQTLSIWILRVSVEVYDLLRDIALCKQYVVMMFVPTSCLCV